MKNKRLLFTSFFVMLLSIAFAHAQVTATGVIVDEATGEPVIGSSADKSTTHSKAKSLTADRRRFSQSCCKICYFCCNETSMAYFATFLFAYMCEKL